MITSDLLVVRIASVGLDEVARRVGDHWLRTLHGCRRLPVQTFHRFVGRTASVGLGVLVWRSLWLKRTWKLAKRTHLWTGRRQSGVGRDASVLVGSSEDVRLGALERFVYIADEEVEDGTDRANDDAHEVDDVGDEILDCA